MAAYYYLQNVINCFTFLYSPDDGNEIKKRLQKVSKENFIIIHYQEEIENRKNFIIFYDNSIIIIPRNDLQFYFYMICKMCSLYSFSLFYTTNFTKEKLQEFGYDSIVLNKIYFSDTYTLSFIDNCMVYQKSCFNDISSRNLQMIVSYLLQRSLINSRLDRIENIHILLENQTETKTFSIKEFIIISQLGTGSSGYAQLAYHIKTEAIFALKAVLPNTEDKIFKRVFENYKNIFHPFIPRFHGTIESHQMLVIDFIEGCSLSKIDKLHLDINDKYIIILEIMFTLKTIHTHNYVYRDLHPNNIIIDHQKSAILIDFDRMIQQQENYQGTVNFVHQYIAPEITKGKQFSFKADIYSLGFLIYYIITEKKPKISYDDNFNCLKYLQFNEFKKEHYLLRKICERCISYEPKKRYNIDELIHTFVFDFFLPIILESIGEGFKFPIKAFYSLFKIIEPMPSSMEIHIIFHLPIHQNDPLVLYLIGTFHYNGEYVQFDINKSIHYLTLSANQNNSKAQCFLGYIYFENKFVKQDIKKSIYYLTLSANNNYMYAQFLLGKIYYEGLFGQTDLNKSIFYLTLSANQNIPEAQALLGYIYYSFNNINKSIQYLTLSANQNNPAAQCILGIIYLFTNKVPQNFDKSFYYLTLSANQNDSYAQYFLGIIYFNGEFVSRDINKSIYYLSLSANQNNCNAMYTLGKIYAMGGMIQMDINKSIHYMTLAANQNNSDAQLFLGFSYFKGTIKIRKLYHYD